MFILFVTFTLTFKSTQLIVRLSVLLIIFIFKLYYPLECIIKTITIIYIKYYSGQFNN